MHAGGEGLLQRVARVVRRDVHEDRVGQGVPGGEIERLARPALRPPGALASGVPDALAAASAARRGADSPRASNTKPLPSTAATTFTARGSPLSLPVHA